MASLSQKHFSIYLCVWNLFLKETDRVHFDLFYIFWLCVTVGLLTGLVYFFNTFIYHQGWTVLSEFYDFSKFSFQSWKCKKLKNLDIFYFEMLIELVPQKNFH